MDVAITEYYRIKTKFRSHTNRTYLIHNPRMDATHAGLFFATI